MPAGSRNAMKTKLLVRCSALLVLASLACTLSSTPTAAPPPPAPTATSSKTTADFYVLNLTDSDSEGLNKRANDIYQNILDTGGAVTRTALIDAYNQLAAYK